MPAFNAEAFIGQAIDSLLHQTYTDFELIISDNASTDKTAAVCEAYAAADSRITYFKQSFNHGAAANFFFVLDKADGELFMWAAADDKCGNADYLRNLIDALDKGVSLGFPNVDVIDAANDVVQPDVMDLFCNCRTRTDFVKMSGRIASHQLYGVFRTAKLRQYIHLLRKHTHLKVFCESLFVRAFIASEPVAYVKKSKQLYRIHDANTSRSQRATRLLADFLVYWRDTTVYYSTASHLPLKLRLVALSTLQLRASRYAAFLAAATVKQTLCRGFTWCVRGRNPERSMQQARSD